MRRYWENIKSKLRNQKKKYLVEHILNQNVKKALKYGLCYLFYRYATAYTIRLLDQDKIDQD